MCPLAWITQQLLALTPAPSEQVDARRTRCSAAKLAARALPPGVTMSTTELVAAMGCCMATAKYRLAAAMREGVIERAGHLPPNGGGCEALYRRAQTTVRRHR